MAKKEEKGRLRPSKGGRNVQKQKTPKKNPHVPIANGKTHGIPHQDDRDNGIGAEVLVAVDAVADGQLAPDGNARGEQKHGKHEPEPVHAVGGADPPQEEAPGAKDADDRVQPETVLGLAEPPVAAGLVKDEPVA